MEDDEKSEDTEFLLDKLQKDDDQFEIDSDLDSDEVQLNKR